MDFEDHQIQTTSMMHNSSPDILLLSQTSDLSIAGNLNKTVGLTMSMKMISEASSADFQGENGSNLAAPAATTGLVNSSSIPIDMRFNDGHLISIVAYSILLVISALGNITVLSTIIKFRLKSRWNRVNFFLAHLAVADLLVTFILMPLEIGWAATVSWEAGDVACRVLSFFRTFGIYLSGFLLVCISLDRYFAVLKPLTLPEANRRGRIMIYTAWLASFLCSFPQAIIFHVEKHPDYPWFEQCITFNFFPSKLAADAYFLFGFIVMYGFPLSMIIICYSAILMEIFKINRLIKKGDCIRRSNLGALGRAKTRTLKMTLILILAFVLTWTPYNIMSLWYFFDPLSASKVDQKVQRALFIFACTNSCVNPCVYGLFHIRMKSVLAQRSQNEFRLQKIEKQPYRVRVRWRPRECLCATNSSQINSSSTGGNLRLRPLYEVNGKPVYLNGDLKGILSKNKYNNCGNSGGTSSRIQQNNYAQYPHYGKNRIPQSQKKLYAPPGLNTTLPMGLVNGAVVQDMSNLNGGCKCASRAGSSMNLEVSQGSHASHSGEYEETRQNYTTKGRNSGSLTNLGLGLCNQRSPMMISRSREIISPLALDKNNEMYHNHSDVIDGDGDNDNSGLNHSNSVNGFTRQELLELVHDPMKEREQWRIENNPSNLIL